MYQIGACSDAEFQKGFTLFWGILGEPNWVVPGVGTPCIGAWAALGDCAQGLRTFFSRETQDWGGCGGTGHTEQHGDAFPGNSSQGRRAMLTSTRRDTLREGSWQQGRGMRVRSGLPVGVRVSGHGRDGSLAETLALQVTVTPRALSSCPYVMSLVLLRACFPLQPFW